MNLNILREFVSLSKNLNFTVTAEQHFVSQSVLSKHISSLEKEVGVSLFVRNRSRVRLTTVGREFAADVEHVLALYDEALRKVSLSKRGGKGFLRVAALQGATHSFLQRAYEEFIAANHDVEVALRVMEGSALMQALDENEVDLAITMVFGQINETWYDAYQIFDDFYGVVIAADHRLASREFLSVEDLAGMVAAVPERNRFREEWQYLNHYLTAAIPDVVIWDVVNSVADFNVLPSVKECFAVVPGHMRHFLDLSRLKFMPLKDLYLRIGICAVWKRSKENPIARDFVDAIAKVVSGMGTDVLRNQVEGDVVVANGSAGPLEDACDVGAIDVALAGDVDAATGKAVEPDEDAGAIGGVVDAAVEDFRRMSTGGGA